MADVPAYPALPGEGPSMETLQHNAEWAKTFEPSVSRLPRTATSLALRRRQYQDVRDYADALEAERAAAQEQHLMEDRNAANYALRSRALDMKDRLDRFKIGTDLRKLDDAESLLPSTLAARAAQLDAAKARKIRDTAITDRQARHDAAKDSFEAALANSDALPDTPEYDDAVLAARNAFPLAEHDIATRELVNRARASSAKRAAAKTTAATATELSLPPSGISATGAVTYHRPTGGESTSLDEKAALAQVKTIDKSILEKSEQWRKSKVKEPDKIPDVEKDIEALRNERANILKAQPPAVGEKPTEVKRQRWARDASGKPVLVE